MIQPQSITFFIDRCLGNRRIVETLRAAGITIKIHDEHFDKGAQDVDGCQRSAKWAGLF